MAGIQGFSTAPIEGPSGSQGPSGANPTYETRLPEKLPASSTKEVKSRGNYGLPSGVEPTSSEGKTFIAQVQMLGFAAIHARLMGG